MNSDEQPDLRQAPESQSAGIVDKAFGPAADEFGKAFQPAGKQLGQSLAVLVENSIRRASRTVKGIEEVSVWLKRVLLDILKNVNEDDIVAPNPRVAVPAIEALTYSMEDECIRDAYVNLLASDMNAGTKSDVHPSFVFIVQNLTASDVRVLEKLHIPQIQFEIRYGLRNRYWSYGVSYSFELSELTSRDIDKSISNLERLGLLRLNYSHVPLSDEFDQKAEQALKLAKNDLSPDQIRAHKANLPDDAVSSAEVFLSRNGLFLSPLGKAFVKVVNR